MPKLARNHSGYIIGVYAPTLVIKPQKKSLTGVFGL